MAVVVRQDENDVVPPRSRGVGTSPGASLERIAAAAPGVIASQVLACIIGILRERGDPTPPGWPTYRIGRSWATIEPIKPNACVRGIVSGNNMASDRTF
jgi:hypothetical protein